MEKVLSFGSIEVGQTWESPSRVVSESDVVSFANLTGDFDPLHMDPEFARNTPFKQPIVHGLLGLSLVAGLGSHSPSVHTAAFMGVSDWKFLRPLYFGDTVYVRTEVIEKRPHGRRRGLVSWKRQLLNQHDQVVQEGIFETLVTIAPPIPAPHQPASISASGSTVSSRV